MRLMLAGLLLGIVHDRRLMREAQVSIAIRWFIGYGLHEHLPDHSSLTRIRQRWGTSPFRRREAAMARFRDVKTLQKFAAVHASIHNHFNHERQLNRRDIFKQNRARPPWPNGVNLPTFRFERLGQEEQCQLKRHCPKSRPIPGI